MSFFKPPHESSDNHQPISAKTDQQIDAIKLLTGLTVLGTAFMLLMAYVYYFYVVHDHAGEQEAPYHAVNEETANPDEVDQNPPRRTTP